MTEDKFLETQSKADVMLLPILKRFANTSIPSKLPGFIFLAKSLLVKANNNYDLAITVLNLKCS